MKQQLKTLGLILLLAGTGDAFAGGFYMAAPPKDVDMCVAAVRERVDTGDAARVQHDIKTTRRPSIGYEIEIATTVYRAGDGAVLHEYESVCRATGGDQPSRLIVTEKP